MQKKNSLLDYQLLFIILVLLIFSCFAVYSGSGQYGESGYYVLRQIIWYCIGIAIMFGVAAFDYELLEKLAKPLYWIGVFSLLLVHLFGVEKNGSQRWISLGFIELQPSEFMKIFLLVYLAVYLKKIGEDRISFKKSIPVVIRIGIITIIPILFIYTQPDLGSSLIIISIALTLFFISSLSLKMIMLSVTVMTSAIGFLMYLYTYKNDLFTQIFKPHQLGRIYAWISPDKYSSGYGYQLKQSMLGIGSGQLTGTGFNQGVQVNMGKIPEAHTDFIFAVIGEDFGFVGASLLLFTYFLLFYRILKIAHKSNTLLGVYICVGAIGLIAFQVFQNIAMTIGLMPITGLALPLISYGGSALITNMIALGLVCSVRMRSKKYIFSDGV